MNSKVLLVLTGMIQGAFVGALLLRSSSAWEMAFWVLLSFVHACVVSATVAIRADEERQLIK